MSQVKLIAATLCGHPVRVQRPAMQFQERELPGGGHEVIPGTQRWLPIYCEPEVELSDPCVVEESGGGNFQQQWTLRGARWHGGMLHYDSAEMKIL